MSYIAENRQENEEVSVSSVYRCEERLILANPFQNIKLNSHFEAFFLKRLGSKEAGKLICLLSPSLQCCLNDNLGKALD